MQLKNVFKRTLILGTAIGTLGVFFAAPLAQAQDKTIKIAHIYSKTGPLEAYGKQTATGFMMGLDYATGGTMTVAGKKLVVIEKDDQGKPDLGKSLLAAAYGDDKADLAVGPTASPVALAMLPVAEEYKKSCWSSQQWPIPSQVTSGTNTFSAPVATTRKTRLPTPLPWTKLVSPLPPWHKTLHSVATV